MPEPRLAISSGAWRQATSGGESLKLLPGAQDLLGMRVVFGVVKRHELAGREWQRKGERLGLGARHANRHFDDLDVSRQRQCTYGGERSMVVRFADELDLEFRLRPVDLFQRRDEFRHDARLRDRARPAPNREAGRQPARPAFRASAVARPTEARRNANLRKQGRRTRRRSAGRAMSPSARPIASPETRPPARRRPTLATHWRRCAPKDPGNGRKGRRSRGLPEAAAHGKRAQRAALGAMRSSAARQSSDTRRPAGADDLFRSGRARSHSSSRRPSRRA